MNSLPIEKPLFTVDAVIFDLDGTLIDSVPIYFELIDVIFARLDIPPVDRQVLLEAMKDGGFEWDLVIPEIPQSGSGKKRPRNH